MTARADAILTWFRLAQAFAALYPVLLGFLFVIEGLRVVRTSASRIRIS